MDYIPTQLIPGTIEYYLYKISARSQAIYLTISIMIILLICSLPFIYVDVSVSAPGFITTQFEQQTLNSPSNGKVLFSRIISNERVVKGDTLLILNTRVQETQLGTLAQKLEENKKSIEDLSFLVNLDSISIINGSADLLTSKYTFDFESFRKKYLHQVLLTKKKEDDFNRINQLYQNDVVSRLEYLTYRFDAEQELTTLGYIMRHQFSTWQADYTARLVEQSVIESKISALSEEIRKKYLLSPMDGTIHKSRDIPVGTYLTINQHLGELSPEGELIISSLVLPHKSGYLYKGQKVRVQVDAYNYNQWGMLESYVMDVSDDVLLDQVANMPYYRVRSEIPNDSLVHRNGSVARIRKGMTVNCRFIQTRESLFTLLVKRADDWLNPSVKNNNK